MTNLFSELLSDAGGFIGQTYQLGKVVHADGGRKIISELGKENAQIVLNQYVRNLVVGTGAVAGLLGTGYIVSSVFSSAFGLGEDTNPVVSESLRGRRGDSWDWLSKDHINDPRYNRGVRHSSGYAGQSDSIRRSREFPGGRLNSLCQAAKYNVANGSKACHPTMGITIRSHEVAIGHRVRGNSVRRRGSSHPNGSRAYR